LIIIESDPPLGVLGATESHLLFFPAKCQSLACFQAFCTKWGENNRKTGKAFGRLTDP
jgi:hypothetical protein